MFSSCRNRYNIRSNHCYVLTGTNSNRNWPAYWEIELNTGCLLGVVWSWGEEPEQMQIKEFTNIDVVSYQSRWKRAKRESIIALLQRKKNVDVKHDKWRYWFWFWSVYKFYLSNRAEENQAWPPAKSASEIIQATVGATRQLAISMPVHRQLIFFNDFRQL